MVPRFRNTIFLFIGILLFSNNFYSQTISIDDVSQAEGDAGTSSFTFTVSVDGGGTALSDIGFTVNTSDNGATAGTDYVAIVNGNGTITTGSSSTTVVVTVNGDTDVEGDETFNVVLSAPSNATIGDGTGLGTIQNDDSQTISIDDVSQAEGDAGTSSFTFTVSVDGGGTALSDIGFTVNTSDNGATAGTDYVAIVNGNGTRQPRGPAVPLSGCDG